MSILARTRKAAEAVGDWTCNGVVVRAVLTLAADRIEFLEAELRRRAMTQGDDK